MFSLWNQHSTLAVHTDSLAYYTRIPGIELSQSETYFNQALTADPEYLGNKVTMAEFYHQKAGNREQFNLFLKKILDTDIVEHPELMIENYFFQKEQKHY